MLDNLPSALIPLFKSGKVYVCKNKQAWPDAHQTLGVIPKLLDRCGGANTFKNSETGQTIHLLGWFDGNLSTLVHEAAHLVFDICADVGIDIQVGKANETYCYLLDWMIGFVEKTNQK